MQGFNKLKESYRELPKSLKIVMWEYRIIQITKSASIISFASTSIWLGGYRCMYVIMYRFCS